MRRSRKRFWKSEDDGDKDLAYKTLHYVLVQLAHVLAPFAPFMAEELYKKLTGDVSVHLRDWPVAGHVNEITVREMDAVRVAVNEGLAIRAKSQLKVRQPLSKITINGGEDLGPLKESYLKVLEEELNVKSVVWNVGGDFEVLLDLELTKSLIEEGISREVVRAIQNARKAAGLQVDDRIVLSLVSGSDELNSAITNNSEYICTETLTTSLSLKLEEHAYVVDNKINGLELEIGLSKA